MDFGVRRALLHYGARTNLKSRAKPSDDRTGLGKVAAGATTWTVRDVTSNSGLEVSPNVRYEPPGRTRGWSADGLWSVDDNEDPLTEELVGEILAGNIYLKIRTGRRPNGFIMGQLKTEGRVEKDQPVELKVTGATLSQAIFGNADLTGAILDNALVNGADLRNVRFDSNKPPRFHSPKATAETKPTGRPTESRPARAGLGLSRSQHFDHRRRAPGNRAAAGEILQAGKAQPVRQEAGQF
jgi:hypothetical protein